MNSRSTWAWVAASILLVVAYWITGKLEVDKQRAQYETKKLFDFAAEDIVRLSISTRENELVEAERVSETEWSIILPYDHIAPNHGVWSQLATLVPQLINQRPIEADPEDLALYGLANPPLTVMVEAKDSLVQLSIGNLDPTQNNRYAQLGADDVFLLPSAMASLLYQPLVNLRDPRVFAEMQSTIDRIHYRRFGVEDAAVSLEEGEAIDEVYVFEDEQWTMTSPFEAPLYPRSIQNLMGVLAYLVGSDHVDDPADLGDYGLAPPWAVIEVINTETGAAQSLALGWLDDMADDGRMFASVEGNPSVFTVDAKLIDQLPNAPGAFRESRLFTHEAKNLTAIHYRDSDRQFTLSNDDARGWMLTDPSFDDTDNLFVSKFIAYMKQQFDDTRFPEVDEIEAITDERIRFSFDFQGGAQSSSFVIGPPVPDSDPPMHYARQDQGTIITIPRDAVLLLQSTPFRFRNKNVFAFDPNAVTVLSITLDGQKTTLAQTDGAWRVVEPQGYGFESQADLVTILSKLPSFLALGLVEPIPADDLAGFNNPVLVAEVEVQVENAAPQRWTLEIGKLFADTARIRYARVGGRSEVFYVDNGYIEDLRGGLKGIVPSQ